VADGQFVVFQRFFEQAANVPCVDIVACHESKAIFGACSRQAVGDFD
jgi:hypothetical protein